MKSAAKKTEDDYVPPMITNALFGGWKSPLFPKGIEMLQKAYDELIPQEVNTWLPKAAKQVANFPLVRVIGNPYTSDNFHWKVGYQYQLSDQTDVVVLFPKKPHNRCERHCAVYVMPNSDSYMAELERFVQELSSTIED